MSRLFSLAGAILFLVFTSVIGTAQGSSSSGIQRADHIEVELISETATVRAGEPFWVALRLLPDAGWHTYWRNPGDSGLETRIRWTLPEGVDAGAILWPIPQHLPVEHLVNYGMEGETFLLTRIEPSRELASDASLRIQASASWLVCEVECLPGSAELELEIPVAAVAEPATEQQEAFSAARERLPIPAPVGWQAGFSAQDGILHLALLTGLQALPAGARVRFFPNDTDLVDHSATQALSEVPGGLHLTQNLSPLFRPGREQVQGVVVVEHEGQSLGFHLTVLEGLPELAASAGAHQLSEHSEQAPAIPVGAHVWQVFSQTRLEELRHSGRPVFVNMTADWCVTCRTNERRALDTPTVREAFRTGNVGYLKGDWTEQDPKITEYLARYGSRGVPLYVLYPPGSESTPQRLPQVLTPEIIVEAVESAFSESAPGQP